jgi:hypothetical protein
MGSGESLRKTQIFPGEKNLLTVLAPLSSSRNHARCAAEGFLSDSPSPWITKETNTPPEIPCVFPKGPI